MTAEELETIRVRLSAATPGPWKAEIFGGMWGVYSQVALYNQQFDLLEDVSDDNAEFIAHAPTDIAGLLAEIERLKILMFNALEDLTCPMADDPTLGIDRAIRELMKWQRSRN